MRRVSCDRAICSGGLGSCPRFLAWKGVECDGKDDGEWMFLGWEWLVMVERVLFLEVKVEMWWHAQRLSRRMDNHLCGWRVIFLEGAGVSGLGWFLLRW